MLNNFLKAVGVESVENDASTTSKSRRGRTSVQPTAAPSAVEIGENFANTIGGWLTFQDGMFGSKGTAAGGSGGRNYYTKVVGEESKQAHVNNNRYKPTPTPCSQSESYHGRKIVPNIYHLYQVVDDKEAYDYYDHLISENGGTRYGSTDDCEGLMNEEDVVDRILSQFPEYGTNRPTPFTVSDEEDETTQEKGAEKSSHPADNSAIKSNLKRQSHEEVVLSPSRLFSDDASEVIGRFFFGMPPTDSSLNAGSTAEGTVGIVPSPSFGSTSSQSTLTSAGLRGKMRGVSVALHGDGAMANVDLPEENEMTISMNGEENDSQLPGWDQDEIDLWKSHDNDVERSFLHPQGRNNSKGTLGNIQMETSLDDRVVRQKKLRGLEQKQLIWDELRVVVSEIGSKGTIQREETDQLLNGARPPTSKASSQMGDVSKATENRGKRNGGAVIVDDGQQHWMPDKLCKQCYSCEASFTLLRRKHHCRLCGMIFCAGCSAYFVQITSSAQDENRVKERCGMMRTCKMCHDHLDERGLGVMIRGQTTHDTTTIPIEVKKSSGLQHAENQSQKKTLSDNETLPTRDSLLPLAKLSQDRPDDHTSSAPLTEQFAGMTDIEFASREFQALNLTKQRLDEERRRRGHLDRDQDDAVDEIVGCGEKNSDGALRIKSRLGSVRQMRWKPSSDDDKIVEKDKNGPAKIVAECNSVEVTVNGSQTHSRSRSTAVQHFPRDVTESGKIVTGENTSYDCHGSGAPHVQQCTDAAQNTKSQLGIAAADYLEKLCRELLTTDSPLLLEEINKASAGSSSNKLVLTEKWLNTLMTITTRCCSTVEPDVKNGDYLDIRPYCKVKVISGGSVDDHAYISGVAFHKIVTHKSMAKVISNAKIMLLSGGIEFTRNENRVSLDAILEQEERYMEILVTKIFKLKPNVLLVGRSVSRKAQELLLRADIALIQHVKPTLMTRIARQTGATVLSSIDHVMNQFGKTILGHCRRFRLVVFRDNDLWTDYGDTSISPTEEFQTSINNDSTRSKKNVASLLLQNLPSYERQAVLAAKHLGENFVDGNDAVRSGLAKRGVVKTYAMIEGCPKELGCTIILRGASRLALKQVKRVIRFMINAAYNMKLETIFLLERGGRLPPSYRIPPNPCCSSSLCVDFGQPLNNRKVRPWNGSQKEDRSVSISGKITPLDHQAILITSVWMTEKTQCCPAEVKGICYYSMQDVSLGQFLRDSCFNLSLKCQNPSCKKSVIDHSLSFIHNDGMINITVERMDNPIPTSSLKKQNDDTNVLSVKQDKPSDDNDDDPIATWTFCTKCEIVVTPLQFISKQTWQWSFGKFLEVYFYNRDAIMNAPGHNCSCQMQTKSVLYFGCGNLAARFTYDKISPYSVFCRRHLPFDESFHRAHSLQDLERISVTSSSLFVKFDKQIEIISRETRELFGSAINKPEHLQAVLSELNLISAEVDNASKVLQERISSVTIKYKTDSVPKNDEALFNFPWHSRRYLFMLLAAWNERLSAAGQAVSAMKKVQSTGFTGRDSAVVPAIGDSNIDDVMESMKRIRQLQESYLRNFNVRNMTMSRNKDDALFENNILPDGQIAMVDEEHELDDDDFLSDQEIDFEQDIDADVEASRKLRQQHQPSLTNHSSCSRQKKTPGTKKPPNEQEEIDSFQTAPIVSDPNLILGSSYDIGQVEIQGKSKAVTAGGALKSAVTRFFNRGGNKEDLYLVDLGMFAKGRPRLQPGINGLIIPVFDDQPSTIIAHSLASSDYDTQFKQFVNASSQTDTKSPKFDTSRKDIERRMLGRNKSHIKHTFRDFDHKSQQLCKFVCTTFWSIQFSAVRQAFMNPNVSGSLKEPSTNTNGLNSGVSKFDIERSYIRSLATSFAWAASGGKSGAAFSRTTDDRFVIKCISRTELQMFLDCAPAYFEYLSKAFFHGLPTVLCKIVGVYQIGYHNRVTGKRTMEQVAVMQNIFFGRKIVRIFDLKGSLKGRFTRQGNNLDKEKELIASKHGKKVTKSPQHKQTKSSDSLESDSDNIHISDSESQSSESSCSAPVDVNAKNQQTNSPETQIDVDNTEKGTSVPTLLDGDFLEFTSGKPLPLTDRAKAVFHMSILNDTLFLSIINVLDYSILVGIDEDKMELVVGIIDFMRQYDILKQIERVGKSLPMVVGSEAPTIIQPPLYKTRFTNAMERYFMTVPSKWTSI